MYNLHLIRHLNRQTGSTLSKSIGRILIAEKENSVHDLSQSRDILYNNI